MSAHIHAALMAQYAQDAAETDKPWERWEWRPIRASETEWVAATSSLSWTPENEYRRKPRTHMVNGIEVPAPMRDAPSENDKFWIASPVEMEWAERLWWGGTIWQREKLERGLVHATKEAAVANAMAMIGRKV